MIADQRRKLINMAPLGDSNFLAYANTERHFVVPARREYRSHPCRPKYCTVSSDCGEGGAAGSLLHKHNARHAQGVATSAWAIFLKCARNISVIISVLHPALGHSSTFGQEYRACVWQAYDDVGESLAPEQITMIDDQDRTDDVPQYTAFKNEIHKVLNESPTDQKREYAVKFGVFFHSVEIDVKIFASLAICHNYSQKITRATPCRNRNYYFFESVPPDYLARTAIRDALSKTLLLPECQMRKGSNSNE
jgi:hypothetical protein